MKHTLSLLLLTSIVFAADTPAKKAEAPKAPAKKVYPNNPAPTVANLKYGPAERNVLDFWQAKSDQPTPLLFFIHGGGWSPATNQAWANSPPASPPASTSSLSTIVTPGRHSLRA